MHTLAKDGSDHKEIKVLARGIHWGGVNTINILCYSHEPQTDSSEREEILVFKLKLHLSIREKITENKI